MEDGRAARKGSFDPKVINLLKRGAVMRIANLSLSNKIPTSTFSIYYLREFDKQERRAFDRSTALQVPRGVGAEMQ